MKLRLNGRFVAARNSCAALRTSSTVIEPQPSEPRPPALLTAAASAGVAEPAIGACMMGCSISSRSQRLEFGHMEGLPPRQALYPLSRQQQPVIELQYDARCFPRRFCRREV